jgi:hypothetical protein
MSDDTAFGGRRMTEAEWLACDDPEATLRYLDGRGSRRQLLLFGVACCRAVWPLLDQAEARRCVEIAEGQVDGISVEAERQQLVLDFFDQIHEAPLSSPAERTAGSLFLTAVEDNPPSWPLDAWNCVFGCAQALAFAAHPDPDSPENGAAFEGALRAHRHVLHEILGNPFRPVALDPGLRTPTVIGLAQAAYDERILPGGGLDAERLLVLADALEDGGADAALLLHLRSPGPHVRGCWALDLILARE